MIMYIGGVANDTEAEGMDRVAIAYTGAQLDLIGELAMKGKPMIMVAMGGGQLDKSVYKLGCCPKSSARTQNKAS
jgi:beta-D-xylosidase 4